MNPIEKGTKTLNGRVASPENVPIHLKFHEIKILWTSNLFKGNYSRIAAAIILFIHFISQEIYNSVKLSYGSIYGICKTIQGQSLMQN